MLQEYYGYNIIRITIIRYPTIIFWKAHDMYSIELNGECDNRAVSSLRNWLHLVCTPFKNFIPMSIPLFTKFTQFWLPTYLLKSIFPKN